METNLKMTNNIVLISAVIVEWQINGCYLFFVNLHCLNSHYTIHAFLNRVSF